MLSMRTKPLAIHADVVNHILRLLSLALPVEIRVCMTLAGASTSGTCKLKSLDHASYGMAGP